MALRGSRWLTGLALAVVAAACGASSPGSSTGNPDATGTGGDSLSGTYGFPGQSALVGTGAAIGDCGHEALLAGGGYAAFEVILVDADLSPSCGDAAVAVGNPTAGKTAIVIQTKSDSYGNAASPDGGQEPIAPGTYPVYFENLSDDDVCMAEPLTALIDVRDFEADAEGAIPVASAVTGSVTYTTIGAGHVTGNFTAEMAALLPSGQFDTTHLTPLSGSFDATACAGL
jgi:hypothetical protein